MERHLNNTEGSTNSRKNYTPKYFTSASGRYSSYTGNKYYRPTQSNRELLHQALLPPSRLADTGDSAPDIIHQDEPRSSSSRAVSTVLERFPSDIDDDRSSNSARRRIALIDKEDLRTNNLPSIKGSSRTYRLRLKKAVGMQKVTGHKFNSAPLQILIAILSWYLLGVISIGTTKILLRDYEATGMTPLALTVQQLFIGFIFLRLWIYIRNGTRPHPIPYRGILSTACTRNTNPELQGYDKLIVGATFFTSGFWLTNISFSCSDASFVETIKASEPITSASLAALWGLEQVSSKEIFSLILICIGLVMSTFGNTHGASVESKNNVTTLMQSFLSCGIIMGSNLSFSFRGLYQKMFRYCPNGSSKLLDDLNLQFRIHEIGLHILLFPLILWEAPTLVRACFGGSRLAWVDGRTWTYLCLSIINGFAFTHYNLASSYILSRISVVHHAALNCMRRLFAIVVTSIAFRVPISFLSRSGILISLGGFLLFTYYKVRRKKKARPLSSLLPVSRTD